MKLTGTLRHHDLGPGAWVLTTGDGQRVALYGDVPAHLDGESVEVDGDEVEGMGIGMVGERMVQVRSVRKR
jgi:hypothetical protein